MRPAPPSAWLAPTSAAATSFHRALIAAQAWRHACPADADPIGRALRASARGAFLEEERAALIGVATRRAELPFAMVEAELGLGLVPPEADAPAAPAAPAMSAEDRLAVAWELCRWTCIPPVWGEFLFRLVRELQPASCLELGTGLGLSGAYQATALRLNGQGAMTTIDIDDAAVVAARGFESLGLEGWITSKVANLDDELSEIAAAAGPVDYAFLDAEHSEAATVRHFEALLPHLAPGAVLVFDDITQTEDMRRAWARVVGHPSVRRVVALRRIGVAVVGERDGR